MVQQTPHARYSVRSFRTRTGEAVFPTDQAMAIHLRPNRLMPFRLAAEGEVVGTHDGTRATLHLGALDDEVVYHHEYGHEVLFTRTMDGAILAVLWRIMDE